MEQNNKNFISCLLNDLLDEIFDFPQKQINFLLDTLKPNDNNPKDALFLLKSLGFSTILPSNIWLIKVKPQYSESLCGFHALFYAKTIMKLIFKAKTLNNQLFYLLKLQSDACFWRFYNKTLKKVFLIPFLDDIDKKDLKEMGPLDASHWDYLIEEGFFKKFPVEISSLFYGYGYFQCGLERISNNEIILTHKNNKISLIFLGITSHWMVILKNSEGEMMLFDSRERGCSVLGSIDIEEVVLQEEKERIADGKKPMSSAERKVFSSNIIDGRFLLSMLFRITKGEFSLKSIYLNRVIFDILRSYEKNINGRNLETYDFEGFSAKNNEFCFEIIEKTVENKENKIKKLIEWLKNEKPPCVLKEDLLEVLLNFGKEHLMQKTTVFLKTWITEVMKLASESEFEGKEALTNVLKEINVFVN